MAVGIQAASPQPYAYDAEALRKKLADAREEGLKRLRRIQRPTIVLGVLILLIGAIDDPILGSGVTLPMSISFSGLASYALILAVTPLQPRGIWGVVAFLGTLVFFVASLQVRSALRSVMTVLGGCEDALNSEVACSFHIALIILRLIGAAVDVSFGTLLFRSLCRRTSAFQRYELIWQAFGVTFVVRGIVAGFTFCSLYWWLDDSFDAAKSPEGSGFAFLFVGTLAVNKRVRQRVHGWLASIGGEVSTAVSISTMFAGLDRDEDVLARTQAILFSVSAADVKVAAFLNTDPDEARVRVPARLGEIDAFISHSWSDDPHGRFAAFQLWRTEFKRVNKREPMVWLDKYCLRGQDQDELARSLPSLPVFISGCREFVLLRGPTVLGRLWCLIEIFTFIIMRETPNGITVVPFNEPPSLQGVEVTAENASAFDVFIMRTDGRFDARRAVCVYQADYVLLTAVMDAYPGGIHSFNRALLSALVDGEASWEKQLALNGTRTSRRGRVEPVSRRQMPHSTVAVVSPSARDDSPAQSVMLSALADEARPRAGQPHRWSLPARI